MPTLKALEDKANAAGDALITSYEKKAQALLRDALDEIRVTMSKIYEKYASGGLLTRAEMTRYNRLVALERELLSSLDPALKKTLAIMKSLPPEVYNESFFRYAWAIDNAEGIRVNWGLLNKEAIIAELANPFDKIAWEEYSRTARRKLRLALNNGLSVGKSYINMARDLKGSFQDTLYRALRIIRTEGQYALNAGNSAAYDRAREEGIEGVRVWSATLDGATRDTHQAMDGRQEDKDGQFTLPGGEVTPYPAWEGLSAGERIQCRCRVRFDVQGISPKYRRSRDGGVIPYQTYPEWYESSNWGSGWK